jgi:hypothetical protein
MLQILLNLVAQAAATLRSPRDGAQMIMAQDIPRRQRWELLALVVVLAAVFVQLVALISDGSLEQPGPFSAAPATLAMVQAVLLFGCVFGVFWIGRRFGGTGGLDDAILLIAWLQFVMLCLQVVQIVVFFISPVLALFVSVAGVGIFFWLLTVFISQLHGFKSLTAIFVVVLISFSAFTIASSILLASFGILLPGAQ